jgi:prolyl-tRNA synthetase
MMRAGMIKKLGAGIYTYMPMGLRVIRKVEAIVREEMNRAGAVELLMPVVQPAELWQETGRFDKMGPELLRVKDRHDRDFVIQPTSEEVVTDIARQELRSYKQLPKNFYQIQTKFRDERRPRFGLMRGREFIMKDAYSFDRDQASAPRPATRSWRRPTARIFDRFRPAYRAVAADSGAIGGDLSEEFQVIAATGEDAIVYCPDQRLRRQHRKGRGLAPLARAARAHPAPDQDAHAGQEHLRRRGQRCWACRCSSTVKSLVLATDETNDKGEIVKSTGLAAAGARRPRHERGQGRQAAGPEGGLPLCHRGRDRRPLRLQARLPGPDRPEEAGQGGGRPRGGGHGRLDLRRQRADFHITGVNWGRDLPEPDLVADIRNVVEGDRRPTARACWPSSAASRWAMCSTWAPSTAKAMNATFLDENGKPQHGDGLLRHRHHAPAGAAIEQNHDERGIIWPDAMAPFTVVICPIGYDRSPRSRPRRPRCTPSCWRRCGRAAGRPRRAPRRDVCRLGTDRRAAPRHHWSDRGLKEGTVEYQHRRDAAATKCRWPTPWPPFVKGRCRHDTGLPRRVAGALACCAAAVLGACPWAGAQVEEPLADSVRTALSAAIARAAPPGPEFAEHRAAPGLPALAGCDERAAEARKTEHHTRIEFLETVWYESRRAGLDTALVLGLIQVESGFRKYAISSAGARGYMQVMPFWTR